MTSFDSAGALVACLAALVGLAVAGWWFFSTRVLAPLRRRNEELRGALDAAREELARAGRYADSVVNGIADPLIILDPDGNIRRVNQALLDLLGFAESEVVGRPAGVLFVEKLADWERTELDGLLRKGAFRDYQINFRAKTGASILASLSASMMRSSDASAGIVVIARDMREMFRLQEQEWNLEAAAREERARRKALEERAQELQETYERLKLTQEQLIQADKMAAVGRLASGVAHELNNPLGGVLGVADILLAEVPPDSQWRKDLDVLKNGAMRCRQIIKNLLGFSRQQEFRIEAVSARKAVETTLDLCKDQVHLAGIELIKDYASHLPPIEASLSHIQQVFLNLIMNAVHAMPSGGRLTIATRAVPGPRVSVAFTDTGIGIAKENLSKIFEPFFTTKAVGKGTGLGLALCHGIVEKHKGRIEVRSDGRGKGATFTVILPARLESPT